jgi:chromate transporter
VDEAMNFETLRDLALVFAPLSLVAIGGVSAILPEIHRQIVINHGWMTDAEFTALYAVAQIAPGPNALGVSLMGWKVAGLPGALVAFLSLLLPSSLLTIAVWRFIHRGGQSAWLRWVQQGLAPAAIGLVLSTGIILTQAADSSWLGFALTALTVVLTLKTKIHPLLLLFGAAIFGATGLL